MDKNTLSEFGWIVIAIIIIAVVILLAPILNKFTADGANKYIDQFFGVEKEQLQAPDLSFDYENLIITAKSPETERYDLYIDREYVGEIEAEHPSTYFDLTDLTAGDHPIAVVAKAKGYKNSPSAAATARKLKPPHIEEDDVHHNYPGDEDYSIKSMHFVFPSSGETEKYVSFSYSHAEMEIYYDLAGVLASRDFTNLIITDLSDEPRRYNIDGKVYDYIGPNPEGYHGCGFVELDTLIQRDEDFEPTSMGLGIKARAEGWIDSDWITYNGRKLEAPALSYDYENLIITNNDTKTQQYHVKFYQDGLYTETVLVKSGETIKYSLADMKAGENVVSVVAKANGYTDSDTVSIILNKLAPPSLVSKRFLDTCECTKNYCRRRAVDADGSYLITTVVSGAVYSGERTITTELTDEFSAFDRNGKYAGSWPIYDYIIQAHKITEYDSNNFLITFKTRKDGYIDSNWVKDTHVHEYGDWSYRCTYFHSRECNVDDYTEFSEHTGVYIDRGDYHEITCTTCGICVKQEHNFELVDEDSTSRTYRCKQCGREKKYVDDKNVAESMLFDKYNSNFALHCTKHATSRDLWNFYDYAEANETHTLYEKEGNTGVSDPGDKEFVEVEIVGHVYENTRAVTWKALREQGCPVCTECGHVLHCYRYVEHSSSTHEVTCYCGNTSIKSPSKEYVLKKHSMHVEDSENGSDWMQCYQCSYYYDTVPHDHDMSGWTCFNDQQHERHCTISGCGYTEYEDHKFVNNVCTVCGYEKGSSSGGADCEHEWGDWIHQGVIGVDGSHSRICIWCNSAIDGPYDDVVSCYVDPNDNTRCIHECIICGESLSTQHAFENGKCHWCGYGCTHNWSDWTKTAEPTCEKYGIETRTCSICGCVQNREVAALRHNWVKVSETEGTCITKSIISSKCSRCGATNSEPGSYGEHKYGSRCDTKHPATWTDACYNSGEAHQWNGFYCKVCTYCGKPEIEDPDNTGYTSEEIKWCAIHMGNPPVYENPTGEYPMQHHASVSK